MELIIEIAGDIIERQELLNGAQIVTLEGASADGVWTMTGMVSWNLGTQREATQCGEGDLTLSRADGAELFATLTRADIDAEPDLESGAYGARLEYDIDGGSGAFESANGTVRAVCGLAEDTFSGRWTLSLPSDG